MVVGKNGPKFKEHEGEPPPDVNPSGPPAKDKNGNPIPPPNSWMMMIRNGTAEGRYNAVNVAMEDFVKDLSRQLSRLVVDATGLKGKYDFLLTWTADMPGMDGAGGRGGPPTG